jgi:hypothetical protein
MAASGATPANGAVGQEVRSRVETDSLDEAPPAIPARIKGQKTKRVTTFVRSAQSELMTGASQSLVVSPRTAQPMIGNLTGANRR